MARRNNRRSGRQSGGSRWVNPGNPMGTKPPPFNPFRSATKEEDVVIEVINGKPTVVAVGGMPTYGPSGPTQSNWLTQNRPDLVAPPATGDGSNKKPEFNGYTPDSSYDEAMSILAANRRRALDSSYSADKTAASDYGLGIGWKAKMADGSIVDYNPDSGLPAGAEDLGASFTGQWAASDASRGGIDPSNPFSRASLLNKSYFTAGRVGEGSYANRGLLTSGAYQRSQQRDAFRLESGKDSLLKQFAGQLQDYRQRRSDAQSTYDTSTLSARNDLFNRNRDLYDRMYPS